MRKKYFTLLLMFSCFAIFSQNNVNINVTDAVSALAIDDAAVTLNSMTLQTDASGDVTFPNIVDGVYGYTITKACYLETTGSVTVSGAEVFETTTMDNQTSADVFIGSSSNMFGTFADGDITLEDGVNTYTKSVTEFDNLVTGVVFGTYNYTFTRPGACDVTGTVDVECSTIDAMSGNVPLFFLSEDASVDTSVTQNNEILTANVTGANITYQWIDCNNGNAPISGETNQSFTATANGSYAVIITDTDCGISDTSNCFEVNTLSVTPFENPLSIKVYPNPVIDNVNITLDRAYQNINIEVYSMLGQLINTITKTNSQDCNINLSDLPSGNYILRINAEGSTLSKTIIKK